MVAGMMMQTLTRQLCEQLMPELISISADASDWTPENFLYDLPDKWDLSFIASIGGVVGYAILSRKFLGRVHLHQLMVHPAKRGRGIGKDMFIECRRRADEPLSLRVHRNNVGAFRFYKREGMTVSHVNEHEYDMISG